MSEWLRSKNVELTLIYELWKDNGAFLCDIIGFGNCCLSLGLWNFFYDIRSNNQACIDHPESPANPRSRTDPRICLRLSIERETALERGVLEKRCEKKIRETLSWYCLRVHCVWRNVWGGQVEGEQFYVLHRGHACYPSRSRKFQ